MDTSALTIDSLFAAPAAMATPAPKADTRKTENAFYSATDEDAAQVNLSRSEGTDKALTDTSSTNGSKPAREFRHVLREKTEGEPSTKNQKASQPKQSAQASDSAPPQKSNQTSEANNVGSFPQKQNANVAGVKTKAESNPASMMSGVKPEKSTPVTSHAVKSTQIKALAATGEKGQLGLKTVLPPKSNGLNGLKASTSEPSQILPATKAQLGTKISTDNISQRDAKVANVNILGDNGKTKELVREAPVHSSKVIAAGKKLQGADISAKGDVTKLSGQHIKDVTKLPTERVKKDMLPEVPADGDGNKTGASGKKTIAKNTLISSQSKVVEKPSHATTHEPDKNLLSADANGKASVRTNQDKSSNAQGKEAALDGNNATNARNLEKLNAKEVQVSQNQPKDRGRSATNHSPTQNFEQVLTNSHPQSATGSQPAAVAASAKGVNVPGQGPSSDVSADIGRQILESIQNSASQQGAERQVTVRLNPPELGQVFIKLQEQNTELTGVLEVSRTQTRFEIEQALPEIIRNLADSGIHVRRFDVVLSEQGRSEQEAWGDQSMANNGRYEHNPADQSAWADEMDFGSLNEWSANNYNYQSFSEPWESLATEGSINMLI